MTPDSPLPPEALAALQQGRVIEAVKLVRKAEGIGLKEAKERVDRFVANDPLLQERQAANRPVGCLVAILVIVSALSAYLYFRGRT